MFRELHTTEALAVINGRMETPETSVEYERLHEYLVNEERCNIAENVHKWQLDRRKGRARLLLLHHRTQRMSFRDNAGSLRCPCTPLLRPKFMPTSVNIHIVCHRSQPMAKRISINIYSQRPGNERTHHAGTRPYCRTPDNTTRMVGPCNAGSRRRHHRARFPR